MICICLLGKCIWNTTFIYLKIIVTANIIFKLQNWDILKSGFNIFLAFPKFCFHGSRSSPSEVFLEKGVLKMCSKFTGEHPCRGGISIKLLKSHFGMGVLLHICCMFAEHLFLRTPLEGCFCHLQVWKMTRKIFFIVKEQVHLLLSKKYSLLIKHKVLFEKMRVWT